MHKEVFCQTFQTYIRLAHALRWSVFNIRLLPTVPISPTGETFSWEYNCAQAETVPRIKIVVSVPIFSQVGKGCDVIVCY